MINLFYFIVGAFFGLYIGVQIVMYVKNKADKDYKIGIESYFSTILLNLNEVSFSKRIAKLVYLRYKDWDIIFTLDKQTLNIFKGDDCVASSNQVGNSQVVLDIIKKIKSKWSSDINDIVIINDVEYSTKYINEYREKNYPTDPILSKIESETHFDIDDILDKINKVGYNNLTESELEFLKNLSK